MTTTTLNPELAFARPAKASAWEKHGEAITTVLCAVFVGAGWLAHRVGLGATGTALIFLVGYGLGGYRQAIEGTTTLLKDRELDVDLLMVVAAIGAAAIGYWFDGALLIFIFALSGTLEGYASARTTRDIEALMALHPEDALVLRDGREQRVPAASLAVNELFIVKPGERIAADGIVAEGTSAVNQASITGESMPADKRPGDEVFAGTINGQAPVGSRCSHIFSNQRDAQVSRPRRPKPPGPSPFRPSVRVTRCRQPSPSARSSILPTLLPALVLRSRARRGCLRRAQTRGGIPSRRRSSSCARTRES